MQNFYKTRPERCNIEELKNLTTLHGSYTCYLGLFVIDNKLVQR